MTIQQLDRFAPTDDRSHAAGDILRRWRHHRRRSQLDLALGAGVSARHLSFVETGRSQPSRRLLSTLAEQLEVPLRERNELMLAAGYAPAYTESRLDSDELQSARAALDHLLAGHEPYPAVVVDGRGDIQLTNRAIPPLLEGVDPALLVPPINIYRLSTHPAGLAPRIRNFGPWAAHLTHRLERLTQLTVDPELVALLDEVRDYPGVAGALEEHDGHSARQLLLSLELDHSAGPLKLHSTITSFGSPNDVTLAELAVESFFPADEGTRVVLGSLTPAR